MNAQTIKRRTGVIRRLLKKKKIGSLVVTKPANVTYTTGFLGEDSWAVITGRGVYLLTDSRYTEQAQGECLGCRIIREIKVCACGVS
jgi:Xaa-Pro aminopeptidase